MIKNTIDADVLTEKARSDDLKESFETLKREIDYKIGIGARAQNNDARLFLEIIVLLCSEGEELDIEGLKERLTVLGGFEDSGYVLRCEKDNSIICEKEIAESEIEREYQEADRRLKALNRED